MSTSNNASPFQIPRRVEGELDHNDSFQALRQQLERRERESDMLSFCRFHQQACSPGEQSTFCLHRDITHAMLLPLLEIHAEASQIATSVLSSRNRAEPERAFTGEARGAYSWLDCILTEERDWCMAEGCPACVVLHVLYSEPTIRVVAVACLLSDLHPDAEMSESRDRLPKFNFWLGALQAAVRRDPLWGDAFWPEIEYRAYRLEMGIKQLMLQCSELRGARKPDEFLSKSSLALNTQANHFVYHCQMRMTPVQPSNFARVQLKMLWEEQEPLSKLIMACWTSLCWNKRKTLDVPDNRPPADTRERSVTS